MVSLASSSQRLLRLSRGRQQAFLRAAALARKQGHCRTIATASAEDVQDWKDSGVVCERNLITFETLHDIQVHSCEVFANNRLFGTYSEAVKDFEWMSFGEFGDKVDQCRAVLKDLGVGPGDKVGMISNNRWEWAAIATACYSLNANLVPMYEAQLPSDWIYILNDCSAKTVFCANKDIWSEVQQHVKPNCPSLQTSVVLSTPADELDAPYALENMMQRIEADSEGLLINKPLPHDLANLIYTSGTTGKPKGVELTHDNFCSNINGALRAMVAHPSDLVSEQDVSLAFLPWAHSFGQTCELWGSMSHGASMGICRGVPNILEDLSLVKPTALFAVPTLYKRVYDGVNNMMQTASPLRRRLMQSALQLGEEKAKVKNGERGPLSMLESIRFKILDSLVLSKIRDRFGGRLRHGFSGGAACPTEVLMFMDSIGIPVCEGYGLTETSPIITLNVPGERRVGSVGQPIGGSEVYIIDEETGKPLPPGEEGEVCAVGPNIMRGYYNNQAATDEVISTAPDGVSRMFHTGDLGRMDENGWVRITGRLKEQYKLENGKYVCPTPIEEAISLSRFISQVVLCGANRPYNVALLVPDLAVIRQHLKIDESTPDEEVIQDDRVRDLIDGEIEKQCTKIKKFEVPKAWAFVPAFTAANQMLTPKMSIRRHKVIQTYGDVISHMYGDEPAVHDSADSRGAHEKHEKAA